MSEGVVGRLRKGVGQTVAGGREGPRAGSKGAAPAGKTTATAGVEAKTGRARTGQGRGAGRTSAARKTPARAVDLAKPRARATGPARAGDDPRIDRAVAFLNRRARVIGAEMIAIGKYLLRVFFDDDPRQVASKSPAKRNSLQQLAARPDCPLSYATLWRSVSLAIQERKLGTDSSMNQLTSTHRIALLTVENPEEKQELAKAAAEKGWSVKKLRTEVRERAKTIGKKRKVRGGGEIALAEGSLKNVAKTARQGALSPERVAALPRARLTRLVGLMEDVAALLTRSARSGRRALA